MNNIYTSHIDKSIPYIYPFTGVLNEFIFNDIVNILANSFENKKNINQTNIQFINKFNN